MFPANFLYAMVDALKITGAILNILDNLKHRYVIYIYHVPFCQKEATA
jgi:hypothetical protein